MQDQLLIGGFTGGKVAINPRYANRHGLIAGATGTGKTVTLQGLAEGFSDIGVPVFMADVKGDLAGLSQPGAPHPKIDERVSRIGIEGFSLRGFPVALWDVFGVNGTPVRATVSEMGPQLLARLLDLNEAQESVLAVIFEFADDEGMLLLDLKDLRTCLEYIGEHGAELGIGFSVSRASVNAILRRLLLLEREGGDVFFGEPALELRDFIQCSREGRGVINVLAADKLIQSPRVYSTFLLWLLSELFETLPEVGDPDKPVLVFFFDEAHLLFTNAGNTLVEKIEQVVRLIRSKGVGVYFVTQSPSDLPETVLGQLGNRVQHALRAWTPADRKAVKAAAQSFRTNPALDTETVITELGVGEALVSVLGEGGVPTPVERTLVRPPASRMGPLTEQERKVVMQSNPLHRVYERAQDSRSAHEVLTERAQQRQRSLHQQAEAQAQAKEQAREQAREQTREQARATPRASSRQSASEAFVKSVVRSVGSSVGRNLGQKLVRGILGSLLRK